MNTSFLKSSVLLLISVTMLFSGCAAALFKPSVTDLSSEYDEIRNYTLKTDISASIGDVMIVEETGHFFKGYRLAGPITYKEQKAFRGQVWIANHTYEGSCEEGSLIVTGGAFQKAGLGVVINEEGAVRCPAPVISIADNDTRGDTYSFEAGEEAPSFVPMKGGIPDYEKGAKRVVMMYGGNSENTIFIFYREFDGNPFFPTKSQDLTFALEPNGIFESQGKTFEVQTIKGNTITFQVIKEPASAKPSVTEASSPDTETAEIAGQENPETEPQDQRMSGQDVEDETAATVTAPLEPDAEERSEPGVPSQNEERIEELSDDLDAYALPGT